MVFNNIVYNEILMKQLNAVVVALILGLVGQGVLAQEEKQQNHTKNVYDASTDAPEAVQIKSLSKKDFSKYACDVCEKYGFDGPKEISCEEDRVNLLNKLRDLRKEKFKQLSDPKVRADEAAKKKVQDEMKSLTDEIKYFPNLASNRLVEEAEKIVNTPPSLAMNRIPYGALLNSPWRAFRVEKQNSIFDAKKYFDPMNSK